MGIFRREGVETLSSLTNKAHHEKEQKQAREKNLQDKADARAKTKNRDYVNTWI